MTNLRRPGIYVENDANPDKVRAFYEVPDALARRVQSQGDSRTFCQALSEMLTICDECGNSPVVATDVAGQRFCAGCCEAHGLFPGESA